MVPSESAPQLSNEWPCQSCQYVLTMGQCLCQKSPSPKRVHETNRRADLLKASVLVHCHHQFHSHFTSSFCPFIMLLFIPLHHSYIKSCNIKEDGNAIRTNGERPHWITPYQKTSNTNPMSKLVSPKTFQCFIMERKNSSP
jgi:hypothetical protein